jgi:hypothetical protein
MNDCLVTAYCLMHGAAVRVLPCIERGNGNRECNVSLFALFAGAAHR